MSSEPIAAFIGAVMVSYRLRSCLTSPAPVVGIGGQMSGNPSRNGPNSPRNPTSSTTSPKRVHCFQTNVKPAQRMMVPSRRRGAKRNRRMLPGPLTRKHPAVRKTFAASSTLRLRKQLSSGSGVKAVTTQHAPRPRHACPHSLRFCSGKFCSIHSSTRCCGLRIVFPASANSRWSPGPPSLPPRSRSRPGRAAQGMPISPSLLQDGEKSMPGRAAGMPIGPFPLHDCGESADTVIAPVVPSSCKQNTTEELGPVLLRYPSLRRPPSSFNWLACLATQLPLNIAIFSKLQRETPRQFFFRVE